MGHFKAISQLDLEEFILLFLSESKIDLKTSEFELSTIADTIVRVLEYLEFTTSLNTLFETFWKLSYPIAVIEPQKENMKGQPYSDINSYAIYIGVNFDKLKELSSIAHDINNADGAIIHSLKKYGGAIKD